MKHWIDHPGVETENIPFGERAADAVKRGLGSWGFIWAQTAIVAVWIALNVTAVALRWDPYPFILLNLAFSTQAAYAAPILQLANNRGDKISAQVAKHTDKQVSEILDILKGPENPGK